MGVGTHGFDAFCSGTGGDCVDGHIALNSAGTYQRGGTGKKNVGRAEARITNTKSMIEERNRWIRDRLAHSDVFGALPDDELDQLIGRGGVATYARGAVVFRKGDPAEEFMIVLYGRIRLSSTSRNGREVLFDLIIPGRCFGEMALNQSAARKVDATAIKASAVFTLRRREVLVCLEAHPEVAVRVIRLLCARLSRAMEMFEDRIQLGLASRSARMLLRLASEYGDGTRIDLKISQSEIAGLVGGTREKVNRQLCAWCRSGIIAVDEGHLTIVDNAALRAIAEAD